MPKSPIADPNEDYPRWYQDVIARAGLAENGPVRGTMVIRPYGFAIWERIQADLDRRIKEAGAQNVYFPLLIPESYLQREAEHVEGFSPELAVVTIAGGKELAEPVVIRPTSETVFGEQMAKWVNSYRDLPLLLNQWANVIRWELRPRLFLRTSEFLWQEGHTVHASEADAAAYSLRIHLDVYRDFLVEMLALPVLLGRKTAEERFAGATNTMTCEGITRDRKALQLATSHELGQNFARAFDITYTAESGEVETAWTTSWGASTRLVGGLIMGHGDERGLRLPPRIAPTQVAIVVVRDEDGAVDKARELGDAIAATGARVEVDADTHTGFGRRAVDWELKGVPVRIDLGPRDLASGEATLIRRDTGEKRQVPLGDLPGLVTDLLDTIQSSMLAEATAFRDSATTDVDTLESALEVGKEGVGRIEWAKLGPEGERRLLDDGISVRCIQRPDGTVPESEDEPDLQAIVARAY
ncbi:MAG TPA: proline--tRNA ligase [Solirubrobacterales bacterium]